MPILPNVPSSAHRRALRGAPTRCLTALLLSTLAGCLAPDRSQRVDAPVRQEPGVEGSPSRLDAAVQTVRRYAVHLLLVPLLDDEQPSRWAVRTAADPCLEGGEATVNGEVIDEGTALPAAFTVERRFDGCRLFADDRLELTGRVVMRVVHDAGQPLRATVDARELRVRARGGVEVAVGDVFDASERLSSTSSATIGAPERHLASVTGHGSRP